MYAEVGRTGHGLLYPKEEEVNNEELDDTLQTNIFNTMLSRKISKEI